MGSTFFHSLVWACIWLCSLISLVATTEGDGHLLCECVGPSALPHYRLDRDAATGKVLLPFWETSSGISYSRPQDFGTKCEAWDKGTAPVCTEQAIAAIADEKDREVQRQHCESKWCFVDEACACGEAKKDKGASMTVADAVHTFIHPSRLKRGPDNKKIHIWSTYANCEKDSAAAADHVKRYCADHDCKEEARTCMDGDPRDEGEGAKVAAWWQVVAISEFLLLCVFAGLVVYFCKSMNRYGGAASQYLTSNRQEVELSRQGANSTQS